MSCGDVHEIGLTVSLYVVSDQLAGLQNVGVRLRSLQTDP